MPCNWLLYMSIGSSFDSITIRSIVIGIVRMWHVTRLAYSQANRFVCAIVATCTDLIRSRSVVISECGKQICVFTSCEMFVEHVYYVLYATHCAPGCSQMNSNWSKIIALLYKLNQTLSYELNNRRCPFKRLSASYGLHSIPRRLYHNMWL